MSRIESGALELPLLPDSAAAVLQMCRGDDAGALRVAESVSRDPSLAGHVLRVANSAAYGGREPIVSLAQAVGRLGLSTVAEITAAVALRGRIFRVPRFEASVRRIWKHSAATAGWAREIARLRRSNVEGAFLCGLLHDVGHPVILQALDDLEKSEGHAFGDTWILGAADELHGRVGAALVRRWGLPEWAASAIEFHHEWGVAVDHLDEVLTTAFADRLAHRGAGDADPGHEDLDGDPLVSALGFYPEDLDALLAVADRIRETVEVLG